MNFQKQNQKIWLLAIFVVMSIALFFVAREVTSRRRAFLNRFAGLYTVVDYDLDSTSNTATGGEIGWLRLLPDSTYQSNLPSALTKPNSTLSQGQYRIEKDSLVLLSGSLRDYMDWSGSGYLISTSPPTFHWDFTAHSHVEAIWKKP